MDDDVVFYGVQATNGFADLHALINVAKDGSHLVVIGVIATNDGKFRGDVDTAFTSTAMTHTQSTSPFVQCGMIGQVTPSPLRWKIAGHVLSINEFQIFIVSTSNEFSGFGLERREKLNVIYGNYIKLIVKPRQTDTINMRVFL